MAARSSDITLRSGTFLTCVKEELQPPPAPWTLSGEAVCCFGTIEAEMIAPHLPVWAQPLHLGHGVPCVLYVARYGTGSTLEYHELIVATLIRIRWRPTTWISHIYVDDVRSMQGGRDIWGLPKVLARFDWSRDEIRVAIENRPACCVRSSARKCGVPAPLRASFASRIQDVPARTSVRGSARISRSPAEVLVDANSPLGMFGFDQCQQAFHLDDLSGTIAAPRLLA